MLPRLLDPENENDEVWNDFGDSGECLEDMLNFGGLKKPDS